MAQDPLLRNAVRAIKQKIIDGAATATPEELAYLGTAIDRIGGRATVLEVEEMGDAKIAEISAHAQSVEAATIASISATRDAAETHIGQVKTSAQAAIDATRDAAISAVTTTKNAAITETNANRDAVIAAAQSFKAQALADVAAAANSVTQQFTFGARAYFFAQL